MCLHFYCIEVHVPYFCLYLGIVLTGFLRLENFLSADIISPFDLSDLFGECLRSLGLLVCK